MNKAVLGPQQSKENIPCCGKHSHDEPQKTIAHIAAANGGAPTAAGHTQNALVASSDSRDRLRIV